MLEQNVLNIHKSGDDATHCYQLYCAAADWSTQATAMPLLLPLSHRPTVPPPRQPESSPWVQSGRWPPSRHFLSQLNVRPDAERRRPPGTPPLSLGLSPALDISVAPPSCQLTGPGQGCAVAQLQRRHFSLFSIFIPLSALWCASSVSVSSSSSWLLCFHSWIIFSFSQFIQNVLFVGLNNYIQYVHRMCVRVLLCVRAAMWCMKYHIDWDWMDGWMDEGMDLRITSWLSGC